MYKYQYFKLITRTKNKRRSNWESYEQTRIIQHPTLTA